MLSKDDPLVIARTWFLDKMRSELSPLLKWLDENAPEGEENKVRAAGEYMTVMVQSIPDSDLEFVLQLCFDAGALRQDLEGYKKLFEKEQKDELDVGRKILG